MEIERDAYVNETYQSAVGTSVAIGQAFGDRAALRRFRTALEGKGRHTGLMGEIQRRLEVAGTFEQPTKGRRQRLPGGRVPYAVAG